MLTRWRVGPLTILTKLVLQEEAAAAMSAVRSSFNGQNVDGSLQKAKLLNKYAETMAVSTVMYHAGQHAPAGRFGTPAGHDLAHGAGPGVNVWGCWVWLCGLEDV